MSTPKTGRPRGAPPKEFSRDPERYAISHADALKALGVSENDAFTIAATWMLGKPVAAEHVGPRRKHGRGAIPAGWRVEYMRDPLAEGSASIEGKAATLRKKAKLAESDPQAKAWRVAMSRASVLALSATRDSDRCASIILELAEMVGETSYAKDVLLPLLAARFVALPD
jgi:hypothetical protein